MTRIAAVLWHRQVTFTTDNQIMFNAPGKQFDAVIVMDCRQCPIHPRLKATFPVRKYFGK